jgi:tRNA-binding EMAP/Myf-like protein
MSTASALINQLAGDGSAASAPDGSASLMLDAMIKELEIATGGAAPAAAAPAPKREKKAKAKKAAPPPKAAAPVVNLADVSALDIRVGFINKAWKHPDSEKLWCEEINVGEDQPRQIASGLQVISRSKSHSPGAPQALTSRTCACSNSFRWRRCSSAPAWSCAT